MLAALKAAVGTDQQPEAFYRILDGVVIDDTGLFNVKRQSGRTSTISTGPRRPRWTDPPTNAYDRRPRPRPLSLGPDLIAPGSIGARFSGRRHGQPAVAERSERASNLAGGHAGWPNARRPPEAPGRAQPPRLVHLRLTAGVRTCRVQTDLRKDGREYMESDEDHPVVPSGWTVVEFDENDDYRPWCSEQTPEEQDAASELG